MKPRFLLDTSTLSEPLRPAPSEALMKRLHANSGRLAIAAVTWHEALFGLYRMPRGKKRQAVHDYLFNVVAPTLPVLPYDDEAADWHARERARLAAAGHLPPFADGQIAAIAKVHALTVVTENARDFAPFGEIDVQSWRA